MKKIAILFVILIAALFIAPGLIGFKVQGQYQNFINGAQQSGLEVVSNDYRRGWFGSNAETTFKLTPPSGAEGAAITFTMLQDIVHGPLSPAGGVGLAFIGTSFQVDGKALFPDEDNEIAHTNVGLNGNGTTLIAIPALKLAGKPGRPEIQFSGADGNLAFDSGLSRFDLELKAPGLWVGGGDNGESITVTDVALSSHSNTGAMGLLLGNGEFKAKQIEFNSPKNAVTVKIDAASALGYSREESEQLAFGAKYAVEAVAVNGIVYGPAEFEMEFANIPAEVVAKLQQDMREVRGQGLTKEQEGMAMMSMLMGAGPDILQANPKISIKRLFVGTPDGDIDGNLSVAAVGLQWGEIGNMQVVLKKLEADAALSMPEKFVRAIMERQAQTILAQQFETRKKDDPDIQMPSEEEAADLRKKMADQQLEFFMQQGLLKRDKTNIFSEAKLSGGLLSVNGKTVPLP